MHSLKTFTAILIALVLFSQLAVNTSCTKPEDDPQDTIVNPPPPPPPLDTVSLVRRLEMHTSLYPNYVINPYRTFSFYYDNLKRVTEVGIKNYLTVLTDSVTTRFQYAGTGRQPVSAILADMKSSLSGPVFSDTCWFTYGTGNKLIKDSTNERIYSAAIGGFVRRPLVREYSYPASGQVRIDWTGSFSATGPVGLLKRDTIQTLVNGNPNILKMQYAQDPATLGSYARGEGFVFSQINNPLALLNISGSAWAPVYANVKSDMLGNQYHPVVYNSNGFAEYLDFLSPRIPTQFYIGGYNKLNQMINGAAAGFFITITPWSQRNTYPAELRVIISNSLAGDSYYYRYFY